MLEAVFGVISLCVIPPVGVTLGLHQTAQDTPTAMPSTKSPPPTPRNTAKPDADEEEEEDPGELGVVVVLNEGEKERDRVMYDWELDGVFEPEIDLVGEGETEG